MFKVTAHVLGNNETTGNSEKVGAMTFVTNRHELALHVARDISLPDDYTANVDCEASIYIGHKRMWVDANEHSLERAAEQLMQLAQDIRKAGIKRRPNGRDEHHGSAV